MKTNSLIKKLKQAGKIIVPLIGLELAVAGCATMPHASLPNKPSQPKTPKNISALELLGPEYVSGEYTGPDRNADESNDYAPKEGVSMGNSYLADSYEASNDIDLVNSVMTGEAELVVTEKGYERRSTGRRCSDDLWNIQFDLLCKNADTDEDYFIDRKESLELLNLLYEKGPQWMFHYIWDKEIIWEEGEE